MYNKKYFILFYLTVGTDVGGMWNINLITFLGLVLLLYVYNQHIILEHLENNF